MKTPQEKAMKEFGKGQSLPSTRSYLRKAGRSIGKQIASLKESPKATKRSRMKGEDIF